MKRFVLTTGAVIAMVFVAAAAGQVAQTVYRGGFVDEPGSSVKVKTLQDEDGRLTLTSFTARRVPVSCKGNATAVLDSVTGSGTVPIGGQGGFRFVDDNGETVLRVSGTVGRRAEGRFRFSGKLDGGEAGDLVCDSGRLLWKAR